MAKLTLNDVSSGFASNIAHNNNNTLLETALENTLSRDGTGPNQMGANFDMNSYRIVNLPVPINGSEAARLADVQNAIAGATVANLITFSLTGQSIEEGTSQEVNGITALRALSPVSGYTIYLRYYSTLGDGGQGYFNAITGAAPGTYVDDTGITILPTGGDGSSCWKRVLNGAINVKWFNAKGDNATNDTVALQKAINSASTNNAHLYIPKGIYLYTTLYFHYDAITNPGYSTVYGGDMIVEGAGCITSPEFWGELYGSSNYTGTVLRSTSTTTDGIILGVKSTSRSENTRIRNISFLGETSGSIIHFGWSPESYLEQCFVGMKGSGTGTAVELEDVWMFAIKSTKISTEDHVGGVGSIGIHHNAGAGGNILHENVTCEGFETNWKLEGSSNITLINSQSRYGTDGMIINGPVGVHLIGYWAEFYTNRAVFVQACKRFTVESSTFDGNLATTATSATFQLGESGGVSEVRDIDIKKTRILAIRKPALLRYENAKNITYNAEHQILVTPAVSTVATGIRDLIKIRECNWSSTGLAYNKAGIIQLIGGGDGRYLCDIDSEDGPQPFTGALDLTNTALPTKVTFDLAADAILTLPSDPQVGDSIEISKFFTTGSLTIQTSATPVPATHSLYNETGTLVTTIVLPSGGIRYTKLVYMIENTANTVGYWKQVNDANNYTGSATWDPANLVDGAGETSASISVVGAALGDFAIASAPYDLQGITCNAYVDATDSVKIRLQNETGGAIDLASGTWRVRVTKR